MKILHVTPSYLPALRYGGPIYSVHGLAKAQAEAGADVHVFTTNIDGADESDVPLGFAVEMEGIKVHYFAPSVGRRLFRSVSMGKALKNQVREFDIVHLHSVFLWPTNAAARQCRRDSVPYVLTPRGMLWRELIEQRSKYLKLLWIWLFERKNVERAAAIHVTAEIEGEKLRELNFRLPRVEQISNGVERAKDYRLADVSKDVTFAVSDRKFLLSLGRMNWKKNLKALVEAAARVSGANLVIAGNQEDGYGTELVQLTRQLELEDRVTIINRHIEGADKEYLFRQSVGFILPSLSENLGNTVLEAMMRGKPVIASNEAGAAEIVAASDCGIVCDPTVESLASAMERFFAEPEIYDDWAQRALRTAEQQYSWSAIATSMLGLYEEVLDAASPRNQD